MVYLSPKITSTKKRAAEFVEIEFFSRYDVDRKEVTALSNLILSFFSDDVELV